VERNSHEIAQNYAQHLGKLNYSNQQEDTAQQVESEKNIPHDSKNSHHDVFNLKGCKDKVKKNGSKSTDRPH